MSLRDAVIALKTLNVVDFENAFVKWGTTE